MSFNYWGKIAQALPKATAQVVSKTAQSVVDTYAATAPRQTGFMASSAYVVTSEESTYGQGVGTPPGDSYLLPEVDKPENDQTAYAAVAANYAEFPELGTRFQPPQPAWYPAVDAAQATMDDELSKVEGNIKGRIS